MGKTQMENQAGQEAKPRENSVYENQLIETRAILKDTEEGLKQFEDVLLILLQPDPAVNKDEMEIPAPPQDHVSSNLEDLINTVMRECRGINHKLHRLMNRVVM